MALTVLHNALIVTGQRVGAGSVVIDDDRIRRVIFSDTDCILSEGFAGLGREELHEARVIDLGGRILMAGGVDAHVHFREPGMTWKADIQSESRAALCGGITTFFDMPNTVPQTTSLQSLEDKARMAAGRSYANYGFHLGATRDNLPELRRAVEQAPDSFAGIKVFLGSSTGGMKVDEQALLEEIFSIRGKTISVHAEDDDIIRSNLEAARRYFGEAIPMDQHPHIRSREACIAATQRVLDLALRHGSALHVLHVSTAAEVELIAEAKLRSRSAAFKAGISAEDSGVASAQSISAVDSGAATAARTTSWDSSSAAAARITAETSINYLWFSEEDYARLGGKIKCNPAIKFAPDRQRLIEALREGLIDTIGSDHAPHLESEKSGANYGDIPSGIPSVELTLPVLLTLAWREGIPLQRIASAFSEHPAEIFGLRDRGRIAPGCIADLVVVDQNVQWTVTKADLHCKCGWSPYEGERLRARVAAVILAGRPVYCSESILGLTPLQEGSIPTEAPRRSAKPAGLTPPQENENIDLHVNHIDSVKTIEKTVRLTAKSINGETFAEPPQGRRVKFD